MTKLFLIIITAIAILSCDSKKTSIAGTVVNANTGEAIPNVLVSYLQCQEDKENCAEIIIAQMYTLPNGSFKFDQKRASKSKKRWLTVYSGAKKIAQQDNIGLTDKNITIQATP